MEVDYILKTSGERLQILCLYLANIIENLLWFALLAKTHLISPSILGDPGAASRDDGIFMAESLQQERESPWALTPYRSSSRSV